MEGGLIEEGKFYRINNEVLFIERIGADKTRYRSDKDSFQKPRSAEFTGASYPPALSDAELELSLSKLQEAADFIEQKRAKEGKLVQEVSAL